MRRHFLSVEHLLLIFLSICHFGVCCKKNYELFCCYISLRFCSLVEKTVLLSFVSYMHSWISFLSLMFLKCWRMDIILLSYTTFVRSYSSAISSPIFSAKIKPISINVGMKTTWYCKGFCSFDVHLIYFFTNPTVNVKVGTANVLWATALLKSKSWVFQIFLIPFIYSLVTLCLFIPSFKEVLYKKE